MNKPITIFIIIIAAVLTLKPVLQRRWLGTSPRPYRIEHLLPNTPEQYILLGHGIDINTAPKRYLEVLPGIGPKLAQRIVDYREGCKPRCFSSPEGIMEVRGIGEVRFAGIRHYIDAK